RLHRIGDETVVVTEMMHPVELFARHGHTVGKPDAGPQHHARHPQLAVLVLLHVAGGVVFIGIHREPHACGNGEERQHMTAGQRTDQGFFGIEPFAIAAVFGRRRGLDDGAIPDAPDVATIVGLVGEIGALALPRHHYAIFGHLRPLPTLAPNPRTD